MEFFNPLRHLELADTSPAGLRLEKKRLLAIADLHPQGVAVLPDGRELSKSQIAGLFQALDDPTTVRYFQWLTDAPDFERFLSDENLDFFRGEQPLPHADDAEFWTFVQPFVVARFRQALREVFLAVSRDRPSKSDVRLFEYLTRVRLPIGAAATRECYQRVRHEMVRLTAELRELRDKENGFKKLSEVLKRVQPQALNPLYEHCLPELEALFVEFFQILRLANATNEFTKVEMMLDRANVLRMPERWLAYLYELKRAYEPIRKHRRVARQRSLLFFMGILLLLGSMLIHGCPDRNPVPPPLPYVEIPPISLPTESLFTADLEQLDAQGRQLDSLIQALKTRPLRDLKHIQDTSFYRLTPDMVSDSLQAKLDELYRRLHPKDTIFVPPIAVPDTTEQR